MTTKIQMLMDLVNSRRSASAGTELAGYTRNYNKIGDFCNGKFDRDWHVSPLSLTANNTETEVMFILQDWASADRLKQIDAISLADKGYDENLPTNQRLFRLLKEYFGLSFSDIYATNCFVFIKAGNMQETLPQKDLVLSAQQFALKEIKIISPKMVVCIGKGTYKAIARACGSNTRGSEPEHGFAFGKTRITGVHHTGQRGVNALGGYDKMREQWRKLGETFRVLL